MDDSLTITVLISTTVVVGISAQVLASFLQIPSIVFLLLFGIILGSSGLDFLHPSLLGSGLEVIVSLSIALILFEGGLNIRIRELSGVSVSLRNLATVGVLITLLGGAIIAHGLSFPWTIAFLYASLVVVTGPTVVTPLLKLVNVERRVATLLEDEGILIDPIGAIVAVIVLNIVISGNVELLVLLKGLFLRLGIGIAIGLTAGSLLSLLLKRSEFLPQKLKNLVVLAALWGSFSLAQALGSESGLLVAVVIGIVLGAASVPEEHLLRQFNEQLSILANSVLFILLAADLSLASVFALGWRSVLAVLALMLVVRPINILLSTWNRGFNWRQRLFLSWIAPRGIVAASMASLFSISLTKQGINGGDAIKALVFLTILMTVFIQGLTAGWVASWLGLRASQVRTVIVGGNPLGQLLTRLLQQRESVILIDINTSDTNSVQLDEISGISNYLDLEELEVQGISSFSTFLALTNNPELNGILAQRALELFRPDTVAMLSEPPLNSGNSLSFAATGVQVAFTSQVSLALWSQYLNQGDVQLVEIVLQSENFSAQQAELEACITAGELIPLLLERGECLRLILANEPWQAGDRITYLLHKSISFKAFIFSQPNPISLSLKDTSQLNLD